MPVGQFFPSFPVLCRLKILWRFSSGINFGIYISKSHFSWWFYEYQRYTSISKVFLRVIYRLCQKRRAVWFFSCPRTLPSFRTWLWKYYFCGYKLIGFSFKYLIVSCWIKPRDSFYVPFYFWFSLWASPLKSYKHDANCVIIPILLPQKMWESITPLKRQTLNSFLSS